MEEFYDANIRVRDLARSVDNTLDKLATKRQCFKWELVKLALEEFVENHKSEL